jgi:beta-xylosidase
VTRKIKKRTSPPREKHDYLVKYQIFCRFRTLWEKLKPTTRTTLHKSTHSNSMCGVGGIALFSNYHAVLNRQRSSTPFTWNERFNAHECSEKGKFHHIQIIRPTSTGPTGRMQGQLSKREEDVSKLGIELLTTRIPVVTVINFGDFCVHNLSLSKRHTWSDFSKKHVQHTRWQWVLS